MAAPGTAGAAPLADFAAAAEVGVAAGTARVVLGPAGLAEVLGVVLAGSARGVAPTDFAGAAAGAAAARGPLVDDAGAFTGAAAEELEEVLGAAASLLFEEPLLLRWWWWWCEEEPEDLPSRELLRCLLELLDGRLLDEDLGLLVEAIAVYGVRESSVLFRFLSYWGWEDDGRELETHTQKKSGVNVL
jgi:hypothetical protein